MCPPDLQKKMPIGHNPRPSPFVGYDSGTLDQYDLGIPGLDNNTKERIGTYDRALGNTLFNLEKRR